MCVSLFYKEIDSKNNKSELMLGSLYDQTGGKLECTFVFN